MKRDQAEAQMSRSNGTIASATYERVRADIIAARIAPGAKLRIREICKHYDVGLSPMREALNRLSSEHLVVLSDQRGFAVSGVSKERLRELTLSRVWLNELAFRRSIENGGQEWEEQLLLSFHRLTRVSRYAETEALGLNPAWAQPHRAFHSALIAACPSDWIKLYCEQLFDQADRYRNLSRSIVMRNRGDIDEHRPLMEVAIARQTDRAVELLTQHMTRTTDILLDHWDDFSITQNEVSKNHFGR